MERVVLIGANRPLGQKIRTTLLKETDDALVVLTAGPTDNSTNTRVSVVTATQRPATDLDQAMRGQDVVFVDLAATDYDLTEIIAAMKRNIVARLIVTDSDGNWTNYTAAAKLVAQAALNDTLILPSHLTSTKATYQVQIPTKIDSTQAITVDLTAEAELIKKLANDPTLYIHDQIILRAVAA